MASPSSSLLTVRIIRQHRRYQCNGSSFSSSWSLVIYARDSMRCMSSIAICLCSVSSANYTISALVCHYHVWFFLPSIPAHLSLQAFSSLKFAPSSAWLMFAKLSVATYRTPWRLLVRPDSNTVYINSCVAIQIIWNKRTKRSSQMLCFVKRISWRFQSISLSLNRICELTRWAPCSRWPDRHTNSC